MRPHMTFGTTRIKRAACAGLAALLLLATVLAAGATPAWAAAPGTVVAWGANSAGQASVPAGLSDVIAIAAGYSHSLALKSDGTVVAWGRNGYGQTSVPAGLSGITAIAGGPYHSLALKRDGTVVAWDWNAYRQTSAPAGLNDVAAIAAGGYYSLALKRDGTVVAWGDNSDGQTSVPAGLSGVTAIAAGYSHSLALVPTDATPPAISADVMGTLGSSSWYTSDVTINWSVVDDESPRSVQPGYDSTTLSSDTAGTPLTCTATSAGGTSSASVTIKRDATAPSTSGSVISAATQATVTLAASDAHSGVAATSYSVHGGAPQPYSGPVTLTAAGAYTISYFSTDLAGNVEAAQTLTFTVNAAPIAVDDSYTTNEETVLSVAAPGVLGNDSDSDTGDTRTVVLVSGASHAASFTLNADGSFSYTPAPHFNGADSFAYQAHDNHGAESAPATVTIAVTPANAAPTVTLSAAAPNPTNTAPIPVTAQFSENVTGFTAGDITVGNATVGSFVAVDSDTYTFALTRLGQGLVTTTIPAGVAQDSCGSPNIAAAQLSRTFDSIPPSVAINQAPGQADSTSASPIHFTVVFNEPVSGFTSSDVTLSGTAGASTAVVTEIGPRDGTTYDVAVSGMSMSSTVIASVSANAAQDAAGNGNSASTGTDNTVTFMASGARPPTYRINIQLVRR